MIWTGGLLRLSGLPHLPGVPHLHVNRPLILFLLTACWKCLVLCDVRWLTAFWVFLWLFGSWSKVSNTWRSFRFLSGDFYLYKQGLSKKLLILDFLCETRAAGLQVSKWKILVRIKQSVKQLLQRRRLILNDHLPKFATENSVWSNFTLIELVG